MFGVEGKGGEGLKKLFGLNGWTINGNPIRNNLSS